MYRFVFILLLINVCESVSGQSIVEDFGSSTAVVLRDPVRQASTDIDAVIYNPAGTVRLEEGWHASFGSVANFNETKAISDGKEYTISENSFLPSLQLVYKHKKWAFSASIASEGGAPSREYKDGSPWIENIKEDFFEEFNTVGSTTHLNRWTGRLGAAYAIDENIALFAGIKFNSLNYKSNLLSEAEIGILWLKGVAMCSSNNFHNEQLVPVFGVNYNISNFNLGLKCELMSMFMRGVEYLEILNAYDKVRKLQNFKTIEKPDIQKKITTPANISLGLSWQINDKLKVAAGGEYFFKATSSPHVFSDTSDYFSLALSATYSPIKKLEFSCGYKKSLKSVAFEDRYNMDGSMANYICHPDNYSVGARYSFSNRLSADCGITLRSNISDTTDDDIAIKYESSPVLFGLGLNYNFKTL